MAIIQEETRFVSTHIGVGVAKMLAILVRVQLSFLGRVHETLHFLRPDSGQINLGAGFARVCRLSLERLSPCCQFWGAPDEPNQSERLANWQSASDKETSIALSTTPTMLNNATASWGLSPRSFNLIFSTSMMTTIGLTGLASVMPTIGREIGIPDPLVATILSLSGILFSVCAPFWARASDRFGRKPLMLVGISGSLISMAGCALVVGAGMAGLGTPMVIFFAFLVARGMFGLLGSAGMPATQAYVAENTSQEARTRTMASLAGASSMGTVLGPMLAPLLVLTPLGLAGPMAGFATISCVILLLVWRLLPESENKPDRAPPPTQNVLGKLADRKPLWRDPRFSPFLLYALAVYVCSAAQAQTLGFMVIDQLQIDPIAAQRYIAGAMIAGAVAGIFAQWVIVRMFNMTPYALMLWGSGVAAAGNLINAIQPSYAAVVFGYAIASLGFGLGRPGYSAGSSLSLERHEQARGAGAIAALAGIAAMTNPLFVWLYGAAHWAPFAICSLVMGGMAIFASTNNALTNAVPKPSETFDTGSKG